MATSSVYPERFCTMCGGVIPPIAIDGTPYSAATYARRAYCSVACAVAAVRDRFCQVCGDIIPHTSGDNKVYSPARYQQMRYCSVRCANRRASPPAPDRPCQQCGTVIPRTHADGHLRTPAAYNKALYCSRTCARLYRRLHPPDTAGWRKTGPKPRPPEERFWQFVRKDGPLWNTTPCWPWMGGTDSTGYGRFTVNKRPYKQVPAHRFSYELAQGAIPADLDIDHLCRNRLCVNPQHLEPVTRRENILRGAHSALRVRTTCRHGHPLTPDNTLLRENGWVRCRECTNSSKRARYAQKKNHPQ